MKKAIIFILLLSLTLTAKSQDRLKDLTGRLELLIAKKEYHEAKKAIDLFYSIQPEKLTELNLVENYEIGRIERRLNILLENEVRLFNTLLESRKVEDCVNYLKEYPNGEFVNEVLKLKSEFETRAELNEFEKVKASNSEEDCRSYLSKYPTGKYSEQVALLLAERIETNLYQKAITENTITAFEMYIEKYPTGRYSTEVNGIIGDAYMLYGDTYVSNQDYHNAIQQYQKYLNRYPNGPNAAVAKANIKKCEREQRKSGANFIGYYYDSSTPRGLYFGGIKTSGISYYANLSSNKHFSTIYDIDHTIDNVGFSTLNYGYAVPTSNVKIGNFSFSNGFAFPLTFPVWGYVGGGFSNIPYFQEHRIYSHVDALMRTEYFQNTDESEFLWFPEFGFMFKLSNVAILRYGIRYYDSRPIVHQFSIGIQIKQK